MFRSKVTEEQQRVKTENDHIKTSEIMKVTTERKTVDHGKAVNILL